MSEEAPGEAETSQADLERLANRIAMLAGDTGEAEAAGYAVSQLARRLGLSGGHLKAIFLAGAGKLGAAGRVAAELSARADRLEGETGQLQHSLEQVDLAFRQMSRERDAAKAEAERLAERLERARAARRVQSVLLVSMLALAAGAGLFVAFGPPLRPLFGLSFGTLPTARHVAAVRDLGASVLAAADPDSALLFRLPGGTRLVVDRLVWRNFNQWAETRLGGRVGYVAVTSLVLEPDAP